MKKAWVVTLVALVYGITLLVGIPARLLVQQLPVPEGVHLIGVQGTWWQGQIDHVQYEDRNLYNLQWQLDGLALLRGQLAIQVQVPSAASNAVHGEVHVHWSLFSRQLQLENTLIRGDLSILNRWLDVPEWIPLRGQMLLSISRFYTHLPWTEYSCAELQGRFAAMDVQGRMGPIWYDLGDYQTLFSCRNGALTAVMDANNYLGLSLDGQWTPQGVSGQVRMLPHEQTPQPFHDAVQLFGQTNSQGQAILELSTD